MTEWEQKQEDEEMDNRKVIWKILMLLAATAVALAACAGPTAAPTEAPTAAPTEAPMVPTEAPTVAPTEAPAAEPTETPVQELTFGLLFVGPYNDHGWSQAHYEAGLYVEETVPGTTMTYIDKVNPADRPGTTPDQLAEELLAQGAGTIIFNSDDMKDASNQFAEAHPDVPVIMASGDQVWADGRDYKGYSNMTNVMGRMEYGKHMAGCAAALTSQTGKIGYLGPLINDETRRLAASAYLGASYCWQNYRGEDPMTLEFEVKWIGFWFNIPGVTADPTQVADDFFNRGFDVVISGIDTTEALVEADKFAGEGQSVWAIPYDFVGACQEAPDVCLGVPYFNWGPPYRDIMRSIHEGTFESQWIWCGPDWADINNPDTTCVGFEKGSGLSAEASDQEDAFIAELAGGLNLWVGPLKLQDGTTYLEDGEVATDQQIWYLPQLLEGMTGQSVAE
jgi:simple sugar transport system substrate-binding protein